MAKNIINKPLNIVMADCFSRYAKYIIQDRALPDIRDGLKPVQRRILYAMYELGLTNDKPYKKSARTVGEVIGKYHPHGDSSIYEAMVRMSQDWKNNIPLLDMHGNNGSIDGDSAAAMRYTETKLAKVANLMLDNIKKETVDFNFNFDDSEKEPTVLPSLFPNLLINGAMGIAAGYATNIPTHNPREIFNGLIYRISHPNCNVDEIMEIIKGPDFPTGGIIQGKEGIKESFLTGKGKFIINSKIVFDESNAKINQIIVKEIPYDNNKSEILRQISAIVIDEEIPGLIEVRDESDKNGINIVIDVKKDRNLTEIKNYLLKKTNLQVSYSTNFIAIHHKKPILVDILTALDAYINFAIEVIVKRSIFNLNKANQRIEIVQGLIKAIDIIDKIIAIIRKSDSKANAIDNLIKAFEFSFLQAEAIVNLKLYRLTRTDISDLNIELKELLEEVERLNKLINSKAIQNKYLSKLLIEYDQLYGYDRKTLIEDNVEKIEINEKAIIEEKEVIVCITKNGYIKQVSKKSYESSNFIDTNLSANDNICYVNNAITTDHLIIFTSFGKTLVLPVYKIKNFKWKDVGQHINEIVTLEANDAIIYVKVVKDLDVLENMDLVILTQSGLVKKTNLMKTLNTKQLKLSSYIKIKPNDEVVSVQEINSNEHYFISCFTSLSNAITFSTAEIPLSEKTAIGVKGFRLTLNELATCFVLSKTLQPDILLVYHNGFTKSNLNKIEIKKRAQTPIKLNKTKAILLSVIAVNDLSWITINENNKIALVDLKLAKNKFTDISSAYYNNLLSVPILEDIKKCNVKPYVPLDANGNDEDEENQTVLLKDE